MSPLSLPLPALCVEVVSLSPDDVAGALGAFGYPGFAHAAKANALLNPAELVARALAHNDLDVRLVEGLPWILARFPELDWDWLFGQCRLLNLQNRLGYLVQLALDLSYEETEEAGLRRAWKELDSSRLATEGTLCRESMREPERRWVRRHRPGTAEHWNLLTTLTADQITHAT